MDFEFKHRFAVEAASVVLANILCNSVILYGSVSAERRQPGEADRLDGLLSDLMVGVSDDRQTQCSHS